MLSSLTSIFPSAHDFGLARQGRRSPNTRRRNAMAWIHISTKSFPSFDRADRERSALIPHLAADNEGESNVKVRVRRRNASRFDVISWRRSEDVKTSAVASVPAPKPSFTTRARFSAMAALALLMHGVEAN
jgi:hypothetical protein